jgi:hypothetical protein
MYFFTAMSHNSDSEQVKNAGKNVWYYIKWLFKLTVNVFYFNSECIPTEVCCATPILQRHKYVILIVHRLRPKVIVIQHSQLSSIFQSRHNEMYVKDEVNM